MKTITNNIFIVDVPDDVIVSNPLEYQMILDFPQSNGEIDKPKIIISLNEIDNYDDYDGEDLLSRFSTSVLEIRFKAELSSYETQSINEYTVYKVNSFTKATFQNIYYDFIYFDALIQINSRYCIEFNCIFEKADEKIFEAIYTSIFDSLKWEGSEEDFDKIFKEVNDRVSEIENRYASSSEVNIPEWERPISEFQIPDDAKEIFDIGGLNFEILQNQSSVETTELSKELQIKLVAKTNNYIKGEELLLLDINENTEVSEKGLVEFSFPVLEIFQNGIPNGSFSFKDGKCENPYLSMSIRGFEYTLDFYGIVTLENGWVGLNGYLKASYNDHPVFDVKIYKMFESENLEWKNYTFKSLEEASQAKETDVEWLELKNPKFEELPYIIFTFKNLKSLWITDNSWSSKLKLNHISERIGELKNLESLHISRTNLKEIPDAIGSLKKLTSIFFADSSITKIPSSIFNLPNLEYLNFDDNLIDHIPESINLPSLYSISLSNNLLTTIPESIIFQPKINSIDITGNPLEFLPKSFNDFNNLKLSIEDKMRLLDYEYRGADKKGQIVWNDAIYFCEEKNNLFSEFLNIINNNNLEKYQSALWALTKLSIGFTHTAEEDYTQIGNHRFGGKPDLPLDIAYPTFIHNYEGETEYKYEFIGQINCEYLTDLQGYLPRQGTLFFFIETIHNIYGSNDNPCKIIYVENNEKLASGNRFEFLEADYFEMFELYRGFKVDASEQLSVPASYSIETNSYLFSEKTTILKDVDDYSDTFFDSFEQPMQNLFPHDYAVNAYGFTQHESPELQASLQLKGKPQDWIILLKVSSAGDMQWGDAGDLFFVIHKSDLAKCDFSNVFITIESS